MIESSPAGTHDLLNTVRHHLHGWRGITALAGIAIVAGLAFNWTWLVAAGIAPVLLSFLPCATMCALGLCMNRMGGRSCSTGTSVRPASRASGTDNTPTPVREISSLIPTAYDAKDRAIPVIAAATGEPEIEQERRLTDA